MIISPQKIVNPVSYLMSGAYSLLKTPMNDQAPGVENSLVKEIKDALDSDLFGRDVIMALKSVLSRHPRIDFGSCKISKEGLLFVSDLIYVPETLRTKIISSSHDLSATGHPGRKKSLKLFPVTFSGLKYDL